MKNFYKVSTLLILGWGFSFLIPTYQNELAPPPWIGIGGCGAGGAGGGSGDGIRWLGEGVSGNQIEAELFFKFNAGQNFSNTTIAPHFIYKSYSGKSYGLSLALLSKTAEVQYRSNQSPNNRSTGGIGDLGLDFSLPVGSSGANSLSLALSIPTGQYDIIRGPDAAPELLPGGLQKGSGIYSSTLSFAWSKDVHKGMWLGDFSYSHPFALSFSGENEFVSNRLSNYKDQKDNERFYYHFKPYGENDLGAFSPSSLSFSLFYMNRSEKSFIHSYGFTFSAPLGVAWIPNEDPFIYDPRPDPDHKAWSAALVYGLEFSRSSYPIFIGFSIPIHDLSEANPDDEFDTETIGAWNLPDWEDFGQQWNIAVGVKGGFL